MGPAPQADHFHLERESTRDLGMVGGPPFLVGDWFRDGGSLLGGPGAVPVSCARTASYTALHTNQRQHVSLVHGLEE